jgi:hypothetical protein
METDCVAKLGTLFGAGILEFAGLAETGQYFGVNQVGLGALAQAPTKVRDF